MPSDEREHIETPQESGAANVNTIKNRQNSEKARHPDQNDGASSLDKLR